MRRRKCRRQTEKPSKRPDCRRRRHDCPGVPAFCLLHFAFCLPPHGSGLSPGRVAAGCDHAPRRKLLARPRHPAPDLVRRAAGAVVCLVLLWVGRLDAQGAMDVFRPRRGRAGWGACSAVRERVVYPMQTLTNLLAALREGDYSLRSRRARRDDALGDVMREINALGETLVTRRREASEAIALLRAVMAEIDVAVFTFDDAGRLRLVNRAGRGDCSARAEQTLVGPRGGRTRPGGRAGRATIHRTLDGGFPRPAPARAGACTARSFREGGRPHQLLVLADVSQPLREEERAAWQRLIRVLGHEINNSLAPIGSIADSLAHAARPARGAAARRRLAGRRARRPGHHRGRGRSRWGGSWARIRGWRGCPRRSGGGRTSPPLVRRAAALETRLTVAVGRRRTNRRRTSTATRSSRRSST